MLRGGCSLSFQGVFIVRGNSAGFCFHSLALTSMSWPFSPVSGSHRWSSSAGVSLSSSGQVGGAGGRGVKEREGRNGNASETHAN